MLSLPFLSAL